MAEDHLMNRSVPFASFLSISLLPLTLHCAPADLSVVRATMDTHRDRLSSMPIMMTYQLYGLTSHPERDAFLCTGTRALYGARFYDEKFRPVSRVKLGLAEHVVKVNDGEFLRALSERSASAHQRPYKRGRIYPSSRERQLHEMDPDWAFIMSMSRSEDERQDVSTTSIHVRSGTRGRGPWSEEKVSVGRGYMREYYARGYDTTVTRERTWGKPVLVGDIYLPAVMSTTLYKADGTFVALTTATVEYRMLTPAQFQELMKFEFPAGTDMTGAEPDIELMDDAR